MSTTLVTWRCPSCNHVEHQPAGIISLGHSCPRRPIRKKWADFVKVGEDD